MYDIEIKDLKQPMVIVKATKKEMLKNILQVCNEHNYIL